MYNRIEIDHAHSLAISREIGERLQASLRVDPELPPRIRNQIKQLRELEGQSPSIVPTMEHVAAHELQPKRKIMNTAGRTPRAKARS
jgi:hypothetical protein